MLKTAAGVFKKFQYELVILALCLYEFVVTAPVPSGMLPWINTSYVLNYRYGFGSRFFIGSIVEMLRLIIPSHVVTVYFLWAFLVFAHIVLCVMFTSYIGAAIRRAKVSGREYKFPIYLAAIFMASPAFISYLFVDINFGRLELFLLGFTLLVVFISQKPVLWFLIPVLCLCAVATHQMFIFFFAPAVMIILLFNTYKYKGKKTVWLFWLTGAVMVGAFVYFQFFSRRMITFTSAENFTQQAQGLYSVGLQLDMIRIEYFEPSFDFVMNNVIGNTERRLYICAFTLILLLPLVNFFAAFWVKCAKIRQTKN